MIAADEVEANPGSKHFATDPTRLISTEAGSAPARAQHPNSEMQLDAVCSRLCTDNEEDAT
jgi:hypothetical protein